MFAKETNFKFSVFNKNEIDNIYLNLLSIIGETVEKVELKELKKDIGDKYKFFQRIPITLVLIGTKAAGKTTFIFNMINAVRDSSKPEIDLGIVKQIEQIGNKLIVYETSDNQNFALFLKKNREIVGSYEFTDQKLLKEQIGQIALLEFDELVIKVPDLVVALQILYTPPLNEVTISVIESYLVQTSIPIFVYICSLGFETKLNDKYFENLRNLYFKFSDSYFYLVLTKADMIQSLFENQNEKEIEYFSFNLKLFLTNLDKFAIKFLQISVIYNKNDKANVNNSVQYLIDFNHNNLAIIRIEYFKCLLRSAVNKFNSSKKKTCSVYEAESFKQKLEKNSEIFEKKLCEFFFNLPKTKEEIKKDFPDWYENLKTEMIKFDNEILKNRSYLSRKAFMTDQIELIKPCFESLFQDRVKKIIMDLVPNITLPAENSNLCTEAIQKVKTSYKLGGFIGIWTKNGVYSDIIVKLFKRLRENKTKIILNCKNYFETCYNQKFSKTDIMNKTHEIVKNMFKVIDSQEVLPREILVYPAKALLVDLFQKSKDEFSAKFLQIVKNMNI